MRKTILFAILLAVVAAPASAQRPPVRDQRLNDPAMQRLMLERQVIRQLVQRAGADLNLDQAARDRVLQILENSNMERRALVQRTNELRRQIQQALASPETPEADFQRLLEQFQQLSEEEFALRRRDQEAIQNSSLSPRQQTLLMLRLADLQQRIRDMIEGRRGAGPGRGGPGAAGAGGGGGG